MVRLVQRDDGRWVETGPACCPGGRRFAAWLVVVNFEYCDCTPGLIGHDKRTCRTVDDGVECGRIILGERCRHCPDAVVHG